MGVDNFCTMFTRFLPPEEGDSFHACSEAYLLLSLRNSLASLAVVRPSPMFERRGGRQKAVAVEGRWRSYRYSATVARFPELRGRWTGRYQ